MDLASVFESYGRVANAPILASIGGKFKSSCRLCGAGPAIQPVTMMDDSNRFCETCVEQTREEVIAQAIQNNPSLARVMIIASSEEIRQSLRASEVRSGLALASALTNASEFLVTQGDGSLQARAHCGLAYVEIDTEASDRGHVSAPSQHRRRSRERTDTGGDYPVGCHCGRPDAGLAELRWQDDRLGRFSDDANAESAGHFAHGVLV